MLKPSQVKTIDSLISGAISSIDNLILKTEGPNAQLVSDSIGLHANGNKLRIKKYNQNNGLAGLSHETSKLKIAGAASLQKERILNIPDREHNNSEIGHYPRKPVQDSNEWAQNDPLFKHSNRDSTGVNRRTSQLEKYSYTGANEEITSFEN